MTKLSANLGFLWTELPLPEAILAAGRAGFDAVECHWPFDYPAEDINAVLAQTGLPMVSLNTRRGDAPPGDFGLAAVPELVDEARSAIIEAVDYASVINCGAVHVMAGKSGGGVEAETVFRGNLDFTCSRAAAHGQTILIEPINTIDMPGYHLSAIDHAAEIVTALGHANLKVLADCYHLHMMGADVVGSLERHIDVIGHVQIAGAPGRNEPDCGDIDYAAISRALVALEYDGHVGAEYRPAGDTEAGLGWMKLFQAS